MGILLLCQFAIWAFRTFGRFYILMFNYLSGRFATCLKICFATSLDVSPLDNKLRSGIETSKGVKQCG